ncbi:MAG: ABC transporter permease [Thermomicrobiales bacterium]
MKASFYSAYPTRSLIRGGQRTLLALFCVAVGVMAIVGLQLVGGMIKDALVGNARVINGGDLSVQTVTPLAQGDLKLFDDLKQQGLLTTYTAVYQQGIQVPRPNGKRANVSFLAVDPAVYPLVGQPTLSKSAGGDFHALLKTPGNAIVSQTLFDEFGGQLGQTIKITAGYENRQFDVKITGVLTKDSSFGQGAQLYTSLATLTSTSSQPVSYSVVYALTPGANQAAQAKTIVEARIPGATVETADGLLKQLQDSVQLINRFLTIVGLLALLIGGVGIINTMQVLLARRRVEIAMLKTTGYQRRDLYLLFGVEAGLLGLIGGVIGALVGIAVAAGIRVLFERTFQLVLTFKLDWGVILGGVAVGLATALIFGLLPIVQAAGVRPTVVLRELPEGRTWRTAAGSVLLVLLLSVLFAVLSTVIIGSLVWGLAAVYGTFAFLGLLSIGFALLMVVIGRLPVPERYSIPFLTLVTLGVLVAIGITFVPALRGVGILLLIATLAGYAIVLAPREWKISTKMAFRNLGRTRGRTVTTLLALFIGVFAVGLVLVLGQGIRQTINGFIGAQLRYNMIALTPNDQAGAFNTALGTVAGDIKAHESVEATLGTQPVDINGQPLGQILANDDPKRQGQPVNVFVRYLSGIQGYDLAAGKAPVVGTPPDQLTDTAKYGDPGRMLNASDAGTMNVMVDASLREAPTNMKVGDKFTQVNQFTGKRVTLTVVGFYKATGTTISINLNAAPVLGSLEATRALGGQTTQTVFYLQVNADKTSAVTDALTAAVPRAQIVNFSDIIGQFGQVLNNLLLMLTAIASLALIAGIIIIANAVALAMLERRRELGIMKAVGYTSRRVLGVVLIENGLIGGIGGLLGMMLVALATGIFSQAADLSLNVSIVTTIGLIVLVAIVAMLVAALVAWSATRVRPLEVLRYE